MSRVDTAVASHRRPVRRLAVGVLTAVCVGTAATAWVAVHGVGARDLTHHEIATNVLELLDGTIDNPAWWAQSIAVTYEQAIGRRIPGQRPDGTFQMSVSKATSLDMEASTGENQPP